MPEEDQAVAIGVSFGLVNDGDGLVVKVELLLAGGKRIGGPRLGGGGGLFTARGAPAVADVLMGENGGALPGSANIGRDIRAGDAAARRANLFVAAHVVSMEVRVDDVLNRLVG